MLPEERKEGSPRFGKLHFPVGLWINSPKKRLAKMSRRWPSAGSVRSTSSDTPSRASDPSDPRPISSPAAPPAKAKPPRHKRLSHLFHRATTGVTSVTNVPNVTTSATSGGHPHSRWASEKKLSELRDPGAPLGAGVSPSPPCILKIFGGAISRGANYKSVLATPRCSARELVREALERYGLDPAELAQFALCDVVGRPGGPGGAWQGEHLREVGDAERPLLLQELWKPKAGWSRRFEIRRRQDLERDRDRDSNDGDGGEGGDGAALPPPSRRLHRNRSRAASGGPSPPARGDPGPAMRRSISDMNLSTRRRQRKALSVAGADGAGPSPPGPPPGPATPGADGGDGDGDGPGLELLSQCLIQPPRDRPYFLLLRGYGKEDFVLFIMTRPQHIFGRLDRRGAAPGVSPSSADPSSGPADPAEPPPHKPDPGPFSVVDTFLDAPDLLPRHCLVQAELPVGRDPSPASPAATVRPFRGAPTTLNGTPLFRRAALRPGDLLGLGAHVLLLYKDPRRGEGARPAWLPPPRPPPGLAGLLGCAGCGRSPRERRRRLRAALRSPRAELRYRPQDETALLRHILALGPGGPGSEHGGPNEGPGQDSGGPGSDSGGPKGDSGGSGQDLGGPKGDSGGPKGDLRSPKEDSGGPGEDSRGPRSDSGGPREDSRGPKGDSGAPRSDSGGPGQDSGGPGEGSRGPREDSGGPGQDSRGLRKDSRGPRQDSGGLREGSRGPGQDSGGPGEDSRGLKKDLRGPKGDSGSPKGDLGGLEEDLEDSEDDLEGPEGDLEDPEEDLEGPEEDSGGPEGGPGGPEGGPGGPEGGPEGGSGGPHEDLGALAPAFLLGLCLEHAAKEFPAEHFPELLGKVAAMLRETVWEKIKEIGDRQPESPPDGDPPPPLDLAGVTADLRPLLGWLANSVELLNLAQAHLAAMEAQLDIEGPCPELEKDLESCDEALGVLDEVIMSTFQQSVYYLTKTLYSALPALLDTNPFVGAAEPRAGPDLGGVPEGLRPPLAVFGAVLGLTRQCRLHPDLASQTFGYLFFFSNASLFNTLMEKGSAGPFFQWWVGVRLRTNLDLVLDGLGALGLGDIAGDFFRKLSATANLLCTPRGCLEQATWARLRAEFPALSPAQLHHVLRHYRLGRGRAAPPAWSPTPEESAAATTGDIFESFSDHPPLLLPTRGFLLRPGVPLGPGGLLRPLLKIRRRLWQLEGGEDP